MQVQQKQTGSGNKGLDWVIVLGMLAAYPKTADLLSLFSPKILDDIFGMSMSLPYGMFCAALVEGTILFLHFDRRAHRVGSAQVVKWILILVSGLCQVFDGYVTTNSINQMSDSLKLVLTFGIPALPLLIAVMVSAIGALPNGDEDDVVVTRARVGIKTRLLRIWEGDKENTELSPNQVIQANLSQNTPAPTPANGQNSGVANPTNRQP